MDTSKIFTIFAKNIKGLFSKESVAELVKVNKIDFACARESLEAVDLTENADDGNIKTSEIVNKMRKLGFYANIKFEAMLEAAKEDERLEYDEFLRVDNERNQIIAKIAAKKEGDVNALLNSYKTLPGVDPKEIDSLLSVHVRVEDIK